MLLHDLSQQYNKRANIKVFATDVHRKSVDFAAAGMYPLESKQSIAPDRIRKFFTETASGIQVNAELRKLVVFAQQNLLKDAPFTKLDLVTCRNVLIYFLPSAQRKVLSLFHFGLQAGGVLFLGPSESPGDLSEEFEAINGHWRIYKKNRDAHLSSEARLFNVKPLESGSMTGVAKPMVYRDPVLLDLLIKVVGSEATASFILDSNRKLVHSFGDNNRFIRLGLGRASLDILDLIDVQFRVAVSGAIHRAIREFEPVTFYNVRFDTGNESQRYKITAIPLRLSETNATYILLRFDEQRETVEVAISIDSDKELPLIEVSHDRMQLLENEMQFTKENLQATIEELESSNEELQSTNEEMLASNEELQSTNEELHSVNEELYTVNAGFQRKIAELTELTHDMDNLLLSTEVHTIFLDVDLRIRKFTPKIAELFHLIPGDIGRPIERFMHTIRFANLQQRLVDVLHNGVSFNVEVETDSGDFFLMRILPYKGQIERAGVVMTLVAITELKKAESRFQHAIEASPGGMLIVDTSGKITLINNQCESIFGFSRGELLGQSIDMLVPGHLRQTHIQHRTDFFKSPRLRPMSQGLDVWGVRKDGSEIPLDVRLSPIETSAGAAVLASIVDMTKSKLLETSLRHEVQQRDRFLATLSHELRNPMAAIVSAATLLNRVADSVPLTVEPSAVILRQATQLTRLLDDLLDVSRVTQGKIKLRLEPVDLRDVCNESLEAMGSSIYAHRHNVRVQLPELPVYVEVDRGRITQVVENVLTNAIKYTPDAGEISLELQTEDDRVAIEICDNGRGIPADLIESIFDMFVQSDSTLEHSDGGMGVGLTLARTLITLHGGTISALSQGVGQGSSFIIKLPLTEKRPVKVVETVPGPSNRRLNIVLIEDNRDARMMLESVLTLGGDMVISVPNGMQGLQSILETQPDLAIIDIGLPGMNGYEIARQVRKNCQPSLTLIALTGYGRDDDRQAVFSAGFDHHLVKPIRIEILDEILLTLKRTLVEVDLADYPISENGR